MYLCQYLNFEWLIKTKNDQKIKFLTGYMNCCINICNAVDSNAIELAGNGCKAICSTNIYQFGAKIGSTGVIKG